MATTIPPRGARRQRVKRRKTTPPFVCITVQNHGTGVVGWCLTVVEAGVAGMALPPPAAAAFFDFLWWLRHIRSLNHKKRSKVRREKRSAVVGCGSAIDHNAAKASSQDRKTTIQTHPVHIPTTHTHTPSDGGLVARLDAAPDSSPVSGAVLGPPPGHLEAAGDGALSTPPVPDAEVGLRLRALRAVGELVGTQFVQLTRSIQA